tara:strand:+ start:609 stop:875 length:267 start_codon:yes stop_codon:yes gene_type:complete
LGFYGGASVVLIESFGSIGSSLLIDHEIEYPVGVEVNANYVGAIKYGFVIWEAKRVYKGRKTMFIGALLLSLFTILCKIKNLLKIRRF